MITLQERVKAITQLKEEYHLNSEEAWRYLKSQEAHSDLRLRMMKRASSKGFSYQPSVREVSRLCEISRASIQTNMRKASVLKVIETKSKNLPKDYFVAAHCPKLDFEIEGETQWTFDYKKFMDDFTDGYCETSDVSAAFSYAMNLFRNSEHRYLQNDGKRFSFIEFLQQPDEMFLDNTPSEGVATLDDFLGELADALDMNELEKTFDNPDYQRQEKIDISGPSHEDMVLLKGFAQGGLYDRARRDCTLSRLDVQRRIALNLVTEFMQFHPGTKANEVIGSVLGQAKISLEKAEARIKRTEKYDVLKNFNLRCAEQSRYEISVVNIHGRWLERMLQ